MRHCGMTLSPEILSVVPRFVPIRAAQRVKSVPQILSLHLNPIKFIYSMFLIFLCTETHKSLSLQPS